MTARTLVLIDGASYLYRAYHALPPLTNAAGEPTGALFGVVNMLRGHLKEAPESLAFVMDAPGSTFRDALDPAYKANRPPMPDDLRAQIEPMLAIVAALGLPILRIAGVEADDVIGTLAVQAAEAGMQVTISTGDKDIAQLVRPGIGLVNTLSGSRLDSEAAVQEKFGVRPDQIADYLALVGDKVDNIPGVDKVGPKTAAKWLGEYGTLEGVMANAGAIPGKVGENLRAALPRLPLNRQLTALRTDVPLPLGLDALKRQPPDEAALRTLYQRYGFNQALRELDGGTATPGPRERPAGRITPPPAATGAAPPANTDAALTAPTGGYPCVQDAATLAAWVARLKAAPGFAFDTETDSLDPMQARLVGISLATAPGEACYIPLAHDTPAPQLPAETVLAALRPLLEDAALPKTGQNGKFDWHVLRRHGIDVAGYHDDTLLQSHVLDSNQKHDMDAQAKRLLGLDTVRYTDVVGKGSKQLRFDQVPLEAATAYAAEDADITLRLARVHTAALAQEPALATVYRDIEMPLVPVLARVEANGVLLDDEALRRQSADLGRRILDTRQCVMAVAGRALNLDSPKQLGALLYEELGLPARIKTPGGAPSTNEEALEAIAELHELPRLILEYRSLSKLRSTYTEKLPEMVNPATGRLHTRYHQVGAATGRMASSDPNLQNIPIRSADGRRIRQAFIAPPGRRLVACDYSQIELRIMAHLSEDPALLRAFAQGADIHRATAAEVFGKPLDAVDDAERRAAKAINFGLIYGMGAFGLARQLDIDRSQAQAYIQRYFQRYPGVHAYMERTREAAREKGYVETVFGRRLYLPYIASRNTAQRAGAERAAINAPMQGTAADIIKRAMLDIDRWLTGQHGRALMILQVHDELVFEVDDAFVPELVEAVTGHMQAAANLRVPLVVDSGSGQNWDEAH